MNQICCIGHITHDRIITPQRTMEMAGGTALYFSWALHAIDPTFDFSLVTKVGDESMDEVRRLREAGVDVTRYGCPHSVFFENVYGSNLDDRRQRVLAKAEPFTIDELMHTSARVYHLGTLLPDDFSLDTIAWLRQRGIVSIDVQGYLRQVVGEDVVPIDWDQSRSLLSQVDVVKFNEMEMQEVTGMTDAHEAARFIASMGVSEVVLTFGSMGSMIYAGGSFYDVPAYAPRQVVDVTGCGDTYSAGYLYGRSMGMDYGEAGRLAAAMCTLKIERAGVFTGSREDVDRILQG